MVGYVLNRPGKMVLLRGAALFVILVGTGANSALAVPSFARKYQTSCATCHYAYPKLNYFGKAFRNNGYRYPAGTDAEMTKEKPISLGAEGYKKMWPKALWPADIAGSLPVGIRSILRANEFESAASNSSFEMPHEFELFASGTIGETFSYFGEVEIENEDNENELEMDFAIQYDPKPFLHVRVGSLTVHPVHDHLRLTAAHYSAYDTQNTPGTRTVTVANPYGGTDSVAVKVGTEQDRWRFRNGQPGVEVWGARNGAGGKGGLTWAGGIGNGQGLNDANDDKDFFARAAYKFGGYGELGGGAPPEKPEFWRDDSFKIGAFYYKGTSTNVYEASALFTDPTAATTVVREGSNDLTIENDFDLVGAEFDWWFRDLNFFGLYFRQSDDNPEGAGEAIDADAWFAEANYVFYPWLIGVLRYGQTDFDFATSPDPETREFLVPAVVFMARANVKFTVEAQMRLDDPGKGNDRYIVAADFAF